MLGAPTEPGLVDRSRSALDLVHRLLITPEKEHPGLDGLLDELARSFGATGAGLADLTEGRVLLAPATPDLGHTWPWLKDTDLLERVRQGTPLEVPHPTGTGVLLLAALTNASDSGWLLWLEDERRTTWSVGERAALSLAALALSRWLPEKAARPRWAGQLGRAILKQQLESAAQLTGRLAHDYGNVLTGILGFTELSLAQPLPAHAPLTNFLKEAYRAAQNGAQLTQQLRQFCRRQVTVSRPCQLSTVLTAEAARLKGLGHPVPELHLELPPQLPHLALDADQVRQILAALFDNAREALAGPGVITVRAAPITLTEADALDLLGEPRPGPHVEVYVRDTGPGLSAEARRRLWTEPFFSTRSRRRGFGLTTIYGIVTTHHGGFSLTNAPGGGAVARLVIPVAERTPTAAPVCVSPSAVRGEKVLVVDDDPLVRQVVTTTLERAGYRVQAVSSADEALASYAAAALDPFRLVLSDVMMPHVNGWDLARRLLRRDAAACVLFMSGRVEGDNATRDFAAQQFELLTKPFRPEGLLRAVRNAIDRGVARGAALRASGEESRSWSST